MGHHSCLPSRALWIADVEGGSDVSARLLPFWASCGARGLGNRIAYGAIAVNLPGSWAVVSRIEAPQLCVFQSSRAVPAPVVDLGPGSYLGHVPAGLCGSVRAGAAGTPDALVSGAPLNLLGDAGYGQLQASQNGKSRGKRSASCRLPDEGEQMIRRSRRRQMLVYHTGEMRLTSLWPRRFRHRRTPFINVLTVSPPTDTTMLSGTICRAGVCCKGVECT